MDYEIRRLRDCKNMDCGLLDCDDVQSCRWLSRFRRNVATAYLHRRPRSPEEMVIMYKTPLRHNLDDVQYYFGVTYEPSRLNRHERKLNSHGDEYETQILLGCTAVLIGCPPTFQRCVQPPSSGRHPIKNMAVHPRRI
jgi:hypothetical protein